MVKWEQDIQEGLERDWHSIALPALRPLINTSIIEANYKVLLRWYMVLARLVTYIPGASSKCFRGCGQEGTAYHIWWQFPKVKRFWVRVYNSIFSVTQMNLTKFPKHALLGCKVEGASENQRRLFTFIFVSTKITISRNWKSASIPFDQLKHKLSQLMLNKRLTAR